MTTNSPNPVDGDVQALIEWLKPQISELETICDEIPFGLNEDDAMQLKVMRIALEQLNATAQPFRENPDSTTESFRDIEETTTNAQPVSDGWIRCTDSLPDAEGKYLVHETLNNRVNHDYWMEPEPAEGFWNHYDTSVTHWQPLPAAPGGQDV